MKLQHPALVDSLRKAYSAERGAALAYVGHAASLRDPQEKARVNEIERDEWNHREAVLCIMKEYGVPPSVWYELKYYVIGRVISLACHVLGRFMPFFFAGRLESGNVCEYFVMMRRFHSLGISKHDEVLHEMGMKEKEHEVYFSAKVEKDSWLPFFERWFGWGPGHSRNDVPAGPTPPGDASDRYCSGSPPREQVPPPDE